MENPLTTLRVVIDEAIEMHQLNLDLLDVLGVLLTKMTDYCKKANIPFDESITSLILKATTIYDDIHATSKPKIMLQKSSDEILQGKRSDEDLTEPFQSIYKGGIVSAER